jgi:hypothetical protein
MLLDDIGEGGQQDCVHLLRETCLAAWNLVHEARAATESAPLVLVLPPAIACLFPIDKFLSWSVVCVLQSMSRITCLGQVDEYVSVFL